MYLKANIDRAIVVTLYDLRGCSNGLFRREEKSPKGLNATICNFAGFAAGLASGERKPTDDTHVSWEKSSFEDYLAMCNRIAKDADGYQKEIIRDIVKDMIRRVEELNVEVIDGKIEASAYLKPISKDNYLGKILIALTEAFKVELPTSSSAPVSV